MCIIRKSYILNTLTLNLDLFLHYIRLYLIFFKNLNSFFISDYATLLKEK